MIGASVVAALVVTLAELGHFRVLAGAIASTIHRSGPPVSTPWPSEELSPSVLVLLVPNLVNLSVDVEVMNACLLPIVLGFLLALERKALPPEFRMRGAHKAFTYALTNLVIIFGSSPRDDLRGIA